MATITMLGTGLIGTFYTQTLHGLRSRDRVVNVYSRSAERASAFAAERGIPRWTSICGTPSRIRTRRSSSSDFPTMSTRRPSGSPRKPGKAVLCTKPLGRTAAEALEMLEVVEKAGVFAGYLEDLVYTPENPQGPRVDEEGRDGTDPVDAIPRDPSRPAQRLVLGPGAIRAEARSSTWAVTASRSAGISSARTNGRSGPSAGARPRSTRSRPRTMPSDSSSTRAAPISQFEVSWTFRGGMDLRDEVSGTEGTIRLDHFLRTGFEMFTATGESGYVAEKAESQKGWLFPVGDEAHELGYVHMFQDMLDAREAGPGADGDLLRRIRGQCHHRRLLQVHEVRPLGAGSARGVAGNRAGDGPRGSGRAAGSRGESGNTRAGRGRPPERGRERPPGGPRRLKRGRPGARPGEARGDFISDQDGAPPRRPDQADPEGQGDRAASSRGSNDLRVRPTSSKRSLMMI